MANRDLEKVSCVCVGRGGGARGPHDRDVGRPFPSAAPSFRSKL